MTEPLFLTVSETADVLGLSDDLVYDLTARGELPCATFGRRKMIPRRAIELVLDRAMAGFDPAALLVRLAGEAGSSIDDPLVDGESPPTTGSTAHALDPPATPRAPRHGGAPLVGTR